MYISEVMVRIILDCINHTKTFNGIQDTSGLIAGKILKIRRCLAIGFRPFLAIDPLGPSYVFVLGYDTHCQDEVALVYGYHAASGTFGLYELKSNAVSGYIIADRFPNMNGNMVEWFTKVFGAMAAMFLRRYVNLDFKRSRGDTLEDMETIIDEMLICPERNAYEHALLLVNCDRRTWVRFEGIAQALEETRV